MTGCLAHGWAVGMFYRDESLTHGSRAYCEVLSGILPNAGQIEQLGTAKSIPMPRHLVLQGEAKAASSR